MTTTFDNSGADITFTTRAGVDFILVLGVDGEGGPLDLTGYTIEAKLDDGTTVHDLPTTLSAPAGVMDTVSVHYTHDLTETLPSLSHSSVIAVSPSDIRSSLATVLVTTDRCFPA